MGAYESGQSFIAGVLAKLPQEQRAQAEAIFNDAAAKEAVALIGDGALARSDYSRHMDSLREKEQSVTDYYTKLDGWYKDNAAALQAAKDAGAGGAGRTGMIDSGASAAAAAAGGNGHAPASAMTPEQIRQIANDAINEAGKDYIAVSAFLTTQGAWHSHVFGEPLDMTELVNNPKLGRPVLGQPGRVYSLQDAYQEKYGDRIAQKNKEADDRRINDEVEKRYRERTQASAGQPFPLRSEASPLDVLSTKEGPAAHTLDSAVAEYERLVSAKST
jgi:hypothetical protein